MLPLLFHCWVRTRLFLPTPASRGCSPQHWVLRASGTSAAGSVDPGEGCLLSSSPWEDVSLVWEHSLMRSSLPALAPCL